VRDRPGTEKRGGRPHAIGGDGSYPVAGRRVVTNAVRVVWGAPGSWRCSVVGRHRESPDHGEWSYLGDNGAGARSNSRGDNVNGGENIVLARKLLLVMWNPV
jgi:hypothetical protein